MSAPTQCTFCYDRQKAGLNPACAKACATESIKFGKIDQLRLQAQERLAEVPARGMEDRTFYDPVNTGAGGAHAMFILRGDARTFNVPRHRGYTRLESGRTGIGGMRERLRQLDGSLEIQSEGGRHYRDRHAQGRMNSGKGSPHFPMQNLLKIRFRISSVVVAPVMASSGRRALYRSSSNISCGTFPLTARVAASSAASESLTNP